MYKTTCVWTIVHTFRTIHYISLNLQDTLVGSTETRERHAQIKTPIIYLKGNLISCQTKSARTFSELAPMDYVHKASEPPGVT